MHSSSSTRMKKSSRKDTMQDLQHSHAHSSSQRHAHKRSSTPQSQGQLDTIHTHSYSKTRTAWASGIENGTFKMSKQTSETRQTATQAAYDLQFKHFQPKYHFPPLPNLSAPNNRTNTCSYHLPILQMSSASDVERYELDPMTRWQEETSSTESSLLCLDNGRLALHKGCQCEEVLLSIGTSESVNVMGD